MQMVYYIVQFLIVMTCICAKLVSVANANHFMKSHKIFFCAFLVLYLKTISLSSLKIMKKSPITEPRINSKLDPIISCPQCLT